MTDDVSLGAVWRLAIQSTEKSTRSLVQCCALLRVGVSKFAETLLNT